MHDDLAGHVIDVDVRRCDVRAQVARCDGFAQVRWRIKLGSTFGKSGIREAQCTGCVNPPRTGDVVGVSQADVVAAMIGKIEVVAP